MTKNTELKKVFIAGATGLAGSSIITHILNNNSSALIMGTYHSTLPFLHHKRVKYIRADLTKKEDCRRAVRGCDCAIMVAANTGGAEAAYTEPCQQVTDNLGMDTFMLEAFSFENVQRVVFVSSATVYQEFDGFITEEQLDWNQEPHSAYIGVGWAKRSAEKLCQFWYEKYGMNIVIVRSSNIYGPYAKFDPKTSNFIPAIIRKAVDKMDPFEVWGSGDVTRDVIYAQDFARAIVLLLTQRDIKFDIFNLGSGKIITVKEVVDLALQYAGHMPNKIIFNIFNGDKPSTIKTRALNCRKIQQAINWKPTVSVGEGIKHTTKWWIKNRRWWEK